MTVLVTDNHDGTLGITGCLVHDNGDGTLRIYPPARIIDNADGTNGITSSQSLGLSITLEPTQWGAAVVGSGS